MPLTLSGKEIKTRPRYHSWQFDKIIPPMNFVFHKFMLAAWKIPTNPHSSCQAGAIATEFQNHPASSMNPKSRHPHWCGRSTFVSIPGPPERPSILWNVSALMRRQASSGRRARSFPSPEAMALPWGQQPQVSPCTKPYPGCWLGLCTWNRSWNGGVSPISLTLWVLIFWLQRAKGKEVILWAAPC